MTDRFSFATGTNANFIDALFEQYRQDPDSVESSWQKFFEGYEFALSGSRGSVQADDAHENAQVEALIHTYRRLGHLSAHVNPLDEKPGMSSELQLASHHMEHISLEKVFHPANFNNDEPMKLADILSKLQQTYCGRIGADFREINDIPTVVWLQEKMEACNNQPKWSLEHKKRIIEKLSMAEGFERFLQLRYLGQKRFSLEGLDALIPMMDVLIDEASLTSGEEICIGMAHRGRLNVLANIMEKSYEKMLFEFEGSEYNLFDIDGDVKYHLGYANKVQTFSGNEMRLYLSPNPSHLEAVDPVVEGFVRCRQKLVANSNRSKIIPILLHGDASFIGQGIVAETLNLTGLEAYNTGGTIHIITNNQIGFTTNYWDSRSCDYPSDIAKVVRAPVLHVNADDPEACIWVAQLAMDYRQKFGRDIVIDLIGYRRHGHNEGDEPGFTQPLMYKRISKQKTVLEKYSKNLVEAGDFTESDIKKYASQVKDRLQKAYENIRGDNPIIKPHMIPKELEVSMRYRKVDRSEIIEPVNTSVPRDGLKYLGKEFLKIPKGFNPHPKIKKLFQAREKMLSGEGKVDWGMGELLAFASMAEQGYKIRLSGQDCKRGTFTSRHAVLFDVENEQPHNIFSNMKSNDAVDVINSPLSEASCLGFEFGYSVADPGTLVLWEAQFGDFSNGAQIIIDQFIAASEAKWSQESSLVLLLPHGHEGMGPEHSSGRPERYLQLCGSLNMQVCNVTTPAQYFHLLRRQALRSFRKPLVIMTPKSLLRHPKVISNFEEFENELGFKEIIDDRLIENKASVETVLACSGKIYYELLARVEADPRLAKPIIRFEQLYPFPWERIREALAIYPNLKKVVWVQEEPQNMGSWSFIRGRLEEVGRERGWSLSYTGRKGSGTTAEGSGKSHQVEQNRIIEEALGNASGWKPKLVSHKKG
ncbi:MAG: 2-oxoglutarate dehydrogenase E1 component [Bdellovibrionota bacterium]